MPTQENKLGDRPSNPTDGLQGSLTKENLEALNRKSGSQPCNVPMQRWLVDNSDRLAALAAESDASRQHAERETARETEHAAHGGKKSD